MPWNAHVGLEIPIQLRDSVARHQANLLELVQRLRAAGMDAAAIEAGVETLLGSYRAELLAAMRALSARRAA